MLIAAESKLMHQYHGWNYFQTPLWHREILQYLELQLDYRIISNQKKKKYI